MMMVVVVLVLMLRLLQVLHEVRLALNGVLQVPLHSFFLFPFAVVLRFVEFVVGAVFVLELLQQHIFYLRHSDVVGYARFCACD